MHTSGLRFINRQTVNMASETIWSFGYGSNMDVVAMEAKKKVKVLGKLVYSIIVGIICLIDELRVELKLKE
jgi:hypothetical protein